MDEMQSLLNTIKEVTTKRLSNPNYFNELEKYKNNPYTKEYMEKLNEDVFIYESCGQS